MRLVCDLHVHSRFSLATSQGMVIPEMARWAQRKGIDLLGTGDFTHPGWLSHLRSELSESPEGLYESHGTRFLLSAEIALVWRQAGKGRRVHLVLLAETFEDAAAVARVLDPFGKLGSNGRPMLKASAVAALDAIWNAVPSIEVIPAHIWTPWYSVFGSKSGFDSLEECFGPHVGRIHALETGLSSDPPMNRLVSSLDRYSLVSSSDAHSPRNLGREATVLDLPVASFAAVIDAMHAAGRSGRIAETIEFHPQHGKYHYDGHRRCGVLQDPATTITKDPIPICPVCGKPLTLGVLRRVLTVADRHDPVETVPFARVIPLEQILSQVFAVGVGARRVHRTYEQLITRVGTELFVLREATKEQLMEGASADIVGGILAARNGNVRIRPGYDGEYGTVTIDGVA